MNRFLFKKLLQNQGWDDNVLVSCNENGIITSIENNSIDSTATKINGFALPGFQNAHSHAFQYAMAGLAEVHDVTHTSDDFWSWRKAMYDLALSVSPEQMEAIAAMLYSEMVRHGYTNVAEFHYVHHDKNGNQYDNLAEMGSRMIAAAEKAGINITLTPIFYQKGGFGKDATKDQKRFISPSIDDYYKLLEASKNACQYFEGANIAIGIHSMRGVDPVDIAEVAKNGPQDIPFHIHISEQLKEIEDSLAYLGKRPVEWLLENVELSDRFHLVHATHLTEQETIGIAKSKANVVLCPTTEGNLGDGLFPLSNYQKNGGKWSIGTDSHIGINPLEELRLLDYGQRLISHKRNIFNSSTEGNSGDFAINMATISGRKAMNNFETQYFKVGEKMNALILDADAPLLATSSNEKLSSAIIYTADATNQLETIVNGKTISKQESNRQEIIRDFKRVIGELGNR
ncbi:MAG TPA: formimidoylglutamate deiminase [Crocinitomicaceae bacterium]|nr:formimidoylglutamate deiminase [Crocinitomicaceae bacterium]